MSSEPFLLFGSFSSFKKFYLIDISIAISCPKHTFLIKDLKKLVNIRFRNIRGNGVGVWIFKYKCWNEIELKTVNLLFRNLKFKIRGLKNTAFIWRSKWNDLYLLQEELLLITICVCKIMHSTSSPSTSGKTNLKKVFHLNFKNIFKKYSHKNGKKITLKCFLFYLGLHSVRSSK